MLIGSPLRTFDDSCTWLGIDWQVDLMDWNSGEQALSYQWLKIEYNCAIMSIRERCNIIHCVFLFLWFNWLRPLNKIAIHNLKNLAIKTRRTCMVMNGRKLIASFRETLNPQFKESCNQNLTYMYGNEQELVASSGWLHHLAYLQVLCTADACNVTWLAPNNLSQHSASNHEPVDHLWHVSQGWSRLSHLEAGKTTGTCQGSLFNETVNKIIPQENV